LSPCAFRALGSSRYSANAQHRFRRRTRTWLVGYAQIGAAEWRIANTVPERDGRRHGSRTQFADGPQKQENQIKASARLRAMKLDVIAHFSRWWRRAWERCSRSQRRRASRHPGRSPRRRSRDLYATYLGRDSRRSRKRGAGDGAARRGSANIVGLWTVWFRAGERSDTKISEVLETFPGMKIMRQRPRVTRAKGESK